MQSLTSKQKGMMQKAVIQTINNDSWCVLFLPVVKVMRVFISMCQRALWTVFVFECAFPTCTNHLIGSIINFFK